MAANGKDMGDLAVLEFTAFTALIMVVNGQVCVYIAIRLPLIFFHSSQSNVFEMAFDTAYWTVINHIFLWGSIAVYFIFCFVIYEGDPFPSLLPLLILPFFQLFLLQSSTRWDQPYLKESFSDQCKLLTFGSPFCWSV